MKFIDLNDQYQRMKLAIDKGIQKVLDHGQYIMGPEVTQLEEQLSSCVKNKHCVAVASGTTALHVALSVLGVGPGDEVITSPFSFFATAEVILLLGAKPVYVDIDPNTFNIDPTQIEAAITAKTKAIMAVNLYGQPAEFDAINAIATQYELSVIEDAAQSLGASYRGRPSGGLATIGCASFFPSKPLGCYGDGGACFTDNDMLAHELRAMINHGQQGRYNHESIGINGRFDTIQAAVLLAKLPHFKKECELRQQVAQWYQEALGDVVQTPYIEPYNQSVFAQYTIRMKNRDGMQKALQKRGIPAAIHYPKGLHQQPISLKIENQHQQLVHTEHAAEQVLSLPFYPYMTQQMVCHIAEAVTDIIKREKIGC